MKAIAILTSTILCSGICQAENFIHNNSLITPALLLEQMEGPGAEERIELELGSNLIAKANAWLNKRSKKSSSHKHKTANHNFSTLIGEDSLGLKAEWKF